MTEYLPKFKPGQTVTFTATAAITGGQLVEVSGDRSVAPAGAASTKVVGVAGHDAKSGDLVTVHMGGVQHIASTAAAITAGAAVQAAADGKVVAGTTAPIGIALNAVPAAGGDVQVLMDR